MGFMVELKDVEGRKFCVVFVQVIDQKAGKVQMRALHGRANVEKGKLTCVNKEGKGFAVPSTAIPNIMPSDDTDILKDSEYFVMVKVDEGIDMRNPDEIVYD
jgi:hypothetical protein